MLSCQPMQSDCRHVTQPCTPFSLVLQIANMKEYIARFGHGSAKLARQAQVRGGRQGDAQWARQSRSTQARLSTVAVAGVCNLPSCPWLPHTQYST